MGCFRFVILRITGTGFMTTIAVGNFSVDSQAECLLESLSADVSDSGSRAVITYLKPVVGESSTSKFRVVF